MNREDFPMLETGVIYFDNGATTFKPKCVVDEVVNYYTKYTANCHRGDYDNSLIVDELYEKVRDKVSNLIGANSSKEIIFTSGTTDSINMVVNGFFRNNLKCGDEVLITEAEHASNVLPWQRLQKDLGIVVKYIPLNENSELSIDSLKSVITSSTKVVSLAHVTNVLGDVRPIYEIGKICKENNIYFVVDGAQSVPHRKVNVVDANIDFLAFSGHKMCGPTGVGVLYGKKELLDVMEPVNLGGGMNSIFENDGSYEYKPVPTKFEAGTPNIAGVIGFGKAIDYINQIGYDKIEEHEIELKKYFMSRVNEIPNIIVYNKNINSSNIVFNLENVFAQDTALYLNHYNINVRAGNHCAKILKNSLHVKNTCRISFYIYNTKEEIDKLIDVLKDSKDIFKVIL